MAIANISDAISGANLLAYAVAGLLFLRFGKKTRDRLFFNFAASFWTLMIETAIHLAVPRSHPLHPYIYLLRLVAFTLILEAVVDKNRKRRI